MKTTKLLRVAAFAAAQLIAGSAFATTFTSTSPNGLDVTTVGATTVGGIVVDLVGLNGAHVVSQLAANTLYVGYYSTNPGTIGTQAGFNSSVTNALGGGLQKASFRFSLWDGDTASGNFDYNLNTLLVNSLAFGNWSSVIAQNTDGNGAVGSAGFSTGGFRDNTLDTGWFSSNNTALLNGLFASILSTNSLTFQVSDATPGDNYYDFTQGLNGSVINVGQGPVIAPPTSVPEPTSLALLGLGLLGFAAKRKKPSNRRALVVAAERGGYLKPFLRLGQATWC